MESDFAADRDDEQIELPPGFRFHPTDEELISHYLTPKFFDGAFSARPIGEVDLNKIEPWELPWKAKMGEKEWYFFCMRGRKYPTGLRTNRATDAGYWKATGKDKEIYRAKVLIGMKKTLVFYRGRAPRGEKTNWVMHEYRLEGKLTIDNLPQTPKGEWVISRVFQKTSGGKKVHISGIVGLHKFEDDPVPSNLPPLMEIFTSNDQVGDSSSAKPPVSQGFTEPAEEKKPKENPADSYRNCVASPGNHFFDSSSASDPFLPNQMLPNSGNFQTQEPVWIQEQSILRYLLENNEQNRGNKFPKPEILQESEASIKQREPGQECYEDHNFAFGPTDMDYLWDY